MLYALYNTPFVLDGKVFNAVDPKLHRNSLEKRYVLYCNLLQPVSTVCISAVVSSLLQ